MPAAKDRLSELKKVFHKIFKLARIYFIIAASNKTGKCRIREQSSKRKQATPENIRESRTNKAGN